MKNCIRLLNKYQLKFVRKPQSISGKDIKNKNYLGTLVKKIGSDPLSKGGVILNTEGFDILDEDHFEKCWVFIEFTNKGMDMPMGIEDTDQFLILK